jgi:RNA 2',3'-cyclic 3'-phosphodiesterase
MRQFLAIPLPEGMRRAAAASRSALTVPGDGWRFVREEGLHLTIRFLGEVDASRRDAHDLAWREAARGAGALTLRLSGASVFPSARRPRVLVLRVCDESSNGSLGRLADRVERAARGQGFRAVPRPLDAHVTLARSRGGAAVVSSAVDRVGDLGSFIAERLVLYRSELTKGGSRYIEEASYLLSAGTE